MKRLLMLCVVSVGMVNICQANEVVMKPELEEVAAASACPCSKSCRCDESCACRTTGCRGCCNQYKDERTKADGTCVVAYCDCESSRCGCGCANDNKSCCS
jgi:hypothetical protein